MPCRDSLLSDLRYSLHNFEDLTSTAIAVPGNKETVRVHQASRVLAVLGNKGKGSLTGEVEELGVGDLSACVCTSTC